MESGTLITKSILPPWSKVNTLGSLERSGQFGWNGWLVRVGMAWITTSFFHAVLTCHKRFPQLLEFVQRMPWEMLVYRLPFLKFNWLHCINNHTLLYSTYSYSIYKYTYIAIVLAWQHNCLTDLDKVPSGRCIESMRKSGEATHVDRKNQGTHLRQKRFVSILWLWFNDWNVQSVCVCVCVCVRVWVPCGGTPERIADILLAQTMRINSWGGKLNELYQYPYPWMSSHVSNGPPSSSAFVL